MTTTEGVDWVVEQAACMDHEELFERIKATATRDAASANEVIGNRFKIEIQGARLFSVFEIWNGRVSEWTQFENKGDKVVVR